METNRELTDYMNGAIERLVANAFRSTLKNPKETAFLMEYGKVVKRAGIKRTDMEEKGTHIPAFLISSITNRCNLFCKGCYARENKICGESKVPMLSAERWKEIFEEAASFGVVFNLLAGGEPLMRKEVIAQAAQVKNMIFPIFTNGLMINQEYLKLFTNHRNLIPVISIEGNRNKTDDRRGAGTYDRLHSVMEELQKSKLLYGASITVTTENRDEVTAPEFIKTLCDLGCQLVFFIEYVPAVPDTDYLAPSQEDRIYVERQQQILRKQYKEMMFLSFPGDEKYMGGCLAAGRGFFHINPYGGAEPCPFSPFSDCSLTEVSFLEAVQSPLFRKLNAAALVGGEHTGGCALFEHRIEVKSIAVG